MKCLFSLIALVLIGTTFTKAHAQGNLITNGSFELPVSNGNNQIIPGGDSTTVAGWTTTLNGVERFSPSIYSVGPAPDGNIIIDLNPLSFTGGGIQQTVSTTVGQSYSLSFMAGTSNAFGRTGDAILGVEVAGISQTFNLLNRQTVAVYSTYTIDFVASSTATTVQFYNLQDSNTHFTFIDNVLIPVAVPEASTFALALPALGMVGAAVIRRRKTAK